MRDDTKRAPPAVFWNYLIMCNILKFIHIEQRRLTYSFPETENSSTTQVEELGGIVGRIAFGCAASEGLFGRGRGLAYGAGLEPATCCGLLIASPLGLDF
jgi:hypothetical protein